MSGINGGPRLPVPGSDDGMWGDVLNDFLSQAHAPDGLLKPGTVSSDTVADGVITNAKLDTPIQTTLSQVTSKYTKPASGIPLSDLAASVQNGMSFAPQPQDNYLVGWTGPPELFVSNPEPTVSEVYLQQIVVTEDASLTTLYFFVTSAGVGMTAGQNFVGIYDTSGARLAQSSDCSSSWASSHVAEIGLVGPVPVVRGQIIYVAMLFNGSTMPKLAGGAQSYWDLPNVGGGVANWASASGPYNTLAPNRFRYMSWSTGETALPSTIDLDYGNPDKAFWVGVK